MLKKNKLKHTKLMNYIPGLFTYLPFGFIYLKYNFINKEQLSSLLTVYLLFSKCLMSRGVVASIAGG